MKPPEARAASRVYDGVWGVLASCFLVPRTPPTLPHREGEVPVAFHPGAGYLRYTLFGFWLAGAAFVLIALVAAGALSIAEPAAGIIALVTLGPLLVLVFSLIYIGIYIRYDATWYVMNERSLRIRTGLWIIHEMTFTFENVQNVAVSQGPLQRFFGIADVVVDTAGGGSAMNQQQGLPVMSLHQGCLSGLDNAQEVRDLILSRLGRSRSAGLGDEGGREPAHGRTWSPSHVNALREIRDAIREQPDA
ncbi:MAG: PH domain-containing protein [Candidatus Hydrogenedentes bacterium]|nr:PH domain-containing protein [Candidatus Hydrogenedentota bacterium]